MDAVQVDLATEHGIVVLYRHVADAGRRLEVAALNAGIGAGGAFATDTDVLPHSAKARDASQDGAAR